MGNLSMSKSKDLTGQRFGRLTVIKKTDKRSRGYVLWECKCDCGTESVYVTSNDLTNNNTSSCGCLRRKFRDLTGQKFGLLTVIRKTDKRKNRRVVWECKCDCGTENVYVSSQALTSGDTVSCGCARTPARSKNASKNLREFRENNYIYGTNADNVFREKANKNNKLGLKGVTQRKRDGKFLATIVFRSKRYFLGSYATKEEAYEARKEAEKYLYKDFLEYYNSLYNK